MLTIKNLHASVAGGEILHGISLTVKPGEVHAIMGPNGSGKSTLANTLAGHPSYQVITNHQSPITKSKNNRKNAQSHNRATEIKLDGQDLLELSPDQRAKAGLFLAFQYPVEVPGVRVTKFLRAAYDARFSDQPNKKFSSILKFNQHLESLAHELEINPDLLKRGLNEGFSGGEKKRLEILAMALLEPKVAILDETDSGLDIDAIKAVATGVNHIVTKYHTGIIVVTHYQRILKFLKPDVVHVMVKGRIVETGGGEVARRLDKEGYKLATSG